MRTFSLLFFASLLAVAAHAQSAHWEPSGGTLTFDQDNELQLVFDDCTPKDNPVKPPAVTGLLLDITSQGSSFSINNGQANSSYNITYAAHPTKEGPLELPAFTVATDKGEIGVPEVSFDVKNSEVPSASKNTLNGMPSITPAAYFDGNGPKSAHWRLSCSGLAFDQACELDLIFDNCRPENDSISPKLPTTAGLSFYFITHFSDSGYTSSNINGSQKNEAHSTYTLFYCVRPTQHGTLSIPAFTVVTDRGDVQVPAASFGVDDSAAAPSNDGNSSITSSLVDAAHATLTPANGEFWAGEVFPIGYRIDFARNQHAVITGHLQCSLSPMTVEDWSKPESIAASDERQECWVYKTRGYVRNPGKIPLLPAQQRVTFIMGDPIFNVMSSEFHHLADHIFVSNAPTLMIKSLPPAPTDFSGAVGQFEFTTKVVPATVAIGEPITWTIALSGTGNWPEITGLPARKVSQDFQIVPTKPKRELKNGSLFDGTLSEDTMLIPSKLGIFTLPAVRFTYFDPKTGIYKTLTTGSVTVTVTPAVESSTTSN